MIEQTSESEDGTASVRTATVHGRWTGYRMLLRGSAEGVYSASRRLSSGSSCFRSCSRLGWELRFATSRRTPHGLSIARSPARSALPNCCGADRRRNR